MRPAFALSLALALSPCALSACATAEPMLSGGRTVPAGRSDLAGGAAFRVPVGDLVAQPLPDDDQQLLAFGAPSGAAPVVFVRHGLNEQIDLGVEAAGSSVRANLRGRVPLGSLAHLMIGVVPHAGVVHDLADGTAFRGGGLVPIVLGLEAFSLYEAWIGVRIGLEHVTGELAGRSVALSGLRTGGVVGLGVGFRRLMVLVELAVDHELWWGSLGDSAIERSGVALTPAFALRIRL